MIYHYTISNITIHAIHLIALVVLWSILWYRLGKIKGIKNASKDLKTIRNTLEGMNNIMRKGK